MLVQLCLMQLQEHLIGVIESRTNLTLSKGTEKMRISSAALVVLLLFELLPPCALCADYVTIYGGPAYSSSTSTGYLDPTLPPTPYNSVANGGTAIGTVASKLEAGVDKGYRAMRWDGTGSPAIELGNLGLSASGNTVTGVYDVNAVGTAVGNSAKYESGVNQGFRAVRWDPSGVPTELESLQATASGYSYGIAFAVNEAGTAVGTSFPFDANDNQIGTRPVRWDGSGTVVTELGNLGLATAGGSYPAGYTSAEATVVNESGTAAGRVEKFVGTSSVGYRAVRWDASGTAATELESISIPSPGAPEAHVTGINDSGTVVGYARKEVPGGSDYRAVRWDGTGIAVTELGNLGINPVGSNSSLAWAINNAGTVVGTVSKYDASLGYSVGDRAVRWDGTGTTATELGNLGVSLGGFSSSVARAVNEAGAAVGWSQAYDTLGNDLGQRAVYWGLDNVAIDLNTLVDPASGWSDLIEARGISDDGWITGLGTFDPDGAGGDAPYDRMFLLNIQQVPEPSTVLLTLCCVVSLTHLARRRARC
jgi:hypothetical protein